MKPCGILVCAVLFSALSVIAVRAQTEHEGMGHQHKAAPDAAKHEHVMKSPTKEDVVDGITVRFWVETMMEHHQMMQQIGVSMEGMKMDMDSTHEISLALVDESTKKPITNAKINLKIIRPDGTDQTKMAMWMEGMEHYGADFKMGQQGKYQILTLFKMGDKKHKAGFYYELSSGPAAGVERSASSTTRYTCPMPSDNYFSHAPGECPKCGMKLVEVDNEKQKKLYTCPMPEDDYFSHEPGECPKCGMNLVPNK